VYAADLNRIRGIGNNFQVIKDVSGYCRTILSCGVRSAGDAALGLTIADTVTIGTENADFDVIGEACETCDASRLHVNIDLMDVRDMNDLDLLRDIGVAGALVATGVHNRAMPVDILQW
jgi:uncharacterized protein related to proFAR isomerase